MFDPHTHPRSAPSESINLCDQVADATLGTGEANDRQSARERYKAFSRVKSRPEAALDCLPAVVELLEDELARETTFAEELFEVNQTKTETIQAQAIDAIDAIVQHDPALLANDDTIEKLVRLHPRVIPTLRPAIVEILSIGGLHADDRVLSNQLVPRLRSLIQDGKQESPESIAATEALGRLIGTGRGPVDKMCDLLIGTYEQDRTGLRPIVIRTAGLGLAGSNPPVGRLREVVPSPDAVDDDAARKASVIGACYALAGSGSAKQLANKRINLALNHESESIRQLVPEAIETAHGSRTPNAFDAKREILEETLYDSSPAVQVATVDSIITLLTESPEFSEDRNKSLRSLILRALIEGSEKAHVAALTACEKYADVMVPGDQIDSEVYRRGAKTAISNLDPRVRRRARDGIEAIALTHTEANANSSTANDDHQRASDTNDEDEVGYEPELQHDQDLGHAVQDEDLLEIKRRSKKLLLQTESLEQLIERYVDSVSAEQRAVVIIAVGQQFKQQSVSRGLLQRQRLLLREGWNEGSAIIYKSIITSIYWGFRYGHLDWKQAQDSTLLEQGLIAQSATVRAHTIDIIGRLLQLGKIGWGYAEHWLQEARTDRNEALRRAAILAEGRALAGGAIDWQSVSDHHFDALNDDQTTVAKAAVQSVQAGFHHDELGWSPFKTIIKRALHDSREAVAKAATEVIIGELQEGSLTWSNGSELLREARQTDYTSVAKLVVETVVTLLRDGNIKWKTVEPFLAGARRDERDSIAQSAVESALFGLGSGIVEWTEVEGYLEDSLEDTRVDVATMAVRAAGAGLEQGTVQWQMSSSFLNKALDDERDPVAKSAIATTGSGLRERTLDWQTIKPFMKRAFESDREVIAAEVLRSVGAGLGSGAVQCDTVTHLLKTTLHDERESVADYSIRAIYTGVSKGQVKWEDSESFIMQTLDDDREHITKIGIITTGTALSKGMVEWKSAESILTTGLHSEQTSVATESVTAVGVGLKSDEVQWTTTEDFLTHALGDDRVAVAEMVLKVVSTVLISETNNWAAVDDLINKAVTDKRPQIRERCLEVVRDGLTAGLIPWSEAKPFVDQGVTDPRKTVSNMAMEIVRHGLGSGEVSWPDVESLFNLSLSEAIDYDAEIAVESIGNGLQAGELEWNTVEEFLQQVLETNREREALSKMAIKAASAGFGAGEVLWSNISPFLWTALNRQQDSVAREAVVAVGYGLGQDVVGWDSVDDFLAQVLQDSRNTVAKEAPVAVKTGLEEGNLDWETAGHFLTQAAAHEIEAVAETAVNAIAISLLDNRVAWSSVRRPMQRALTDARASVQKMAVMGVGAGLSNSNLSWDDIQDPIIERVSSGSVSVADSALTVIGTGLSEGSIKWSSVEVPLTNAVTRSTEEIAESAIAAATAGFIAGKVNWESMEPFLQQSIVDQRKSIATRATNTVKLGIDKNIITRTMAASLLKTALESHPSLSSSVIGALDGSKIEIRDDVPDSLLEISKQLLTVNEIHSIDQFRFFDSFIRTVAMEGSAPELITETVKIAIDAYPPGTRELAIEQVNHGIQGGMGKMVPVGEFCREGMTDTDWGVRRETVRTAALGLKTEPSNIDSDTLNCLVTQAAKGKSSHTPEDDVHPEVRARAIYGLAFTQTHSSSLSEDIVDIFQTASIANDTIVRYATYEAIGTVLTNTQSVADWEHQRLFAILSDVISDPEIPLDDRHKATESLMKIVTENGIITEFEQTPKAIPVALRSLSINPRARIKLVDALMKIDQPVK